MTSRSLLAAIAAAALAGVIGTSGLGRAQDILSEEDADAMFEEFMEGVQKDKADQKSCRGNRGTSKAEQEAACTRLIEKAPNENDLVGEYYVDRAMAREDDADKCQDVRKGIAIIKRSKSTIYGQDFLDAAAHLEDVVCE